MKAFSHTPHESVWILCSSLYTVTKYWDIPIVYWGRAPLVQQGVCGDILASFNSKLYHFFAVYFWHFPWTDCSCFTCTYYVQMLWGLNELMIEKHLEQCLSQGKYSINISYDYHDSRQAQSITTLIVLVSFSDYITELKELKQLACNPFFPFAGSESMLLLLKKDKSQSNGLIHWTSSVEVAAFVHRLLHYFRNLTSIPVPCWLGSFASQ